MTAIPETNDPRAAQRLAWARTALGDPQASLDRASTDAGVRSYWRSSGSGVARIVMDSPPDKEDVRPWLRLRDLLEAGEVRVPHRAEAVADAIRQAAGENDLVVVFGASAVNGLSRGSLESRMRSGLRSSLSCESSLNASL